MEKADVLGNFFVSVFTAKYSRQTAQVIKVKGRDWEADKLLTVGESQNLKTI